MSVREKFESLADQWIVHCKSSMLSSDIRDYLDHPSYCELVSLGSEALPFIMERYLDDEFTPWGFLLDDITGLGVIENRNRFKPELVKKRWFEWWEANQNTVENGEIIPTRVGQSSQSSR